jgi:hypothetical protein
VLKVFAILFIIGFLFWLSRRTPSADKHVKP